MNKTNIIVIIMVLLLFSGCVKTSNAALSFEFDTEGNYTGFRDLPEHYTAEQAEKDGCYVHVNSEMVAGEQLWKDYIKDTSNGKDASIRIVLIWDDETFYQDLFYTDGYHRIFDSSSEDLQDYKYKYLLTLEGTMPNAAKSGTVTILTGDKALTYDDIMWQFLSSNPKPISSFRMVSIKLYSFSDSI